MRRTIAAIFLILATFICGCGKNAQPRVLPEKGDFSFILPEGYSLDDISDTECTIINEGGTAVGGIRLADILPKELADKKSTALPRYLDSRVPGCEFFSWVGSDPKNPVHYVTQQFSDPETQERRAIYRLIFVKNDIVYDLYLDTALISDDEIERFHSVAENP